MAKSFDGTKIEQKGAKKPGVPHALDRLIRSRGKRTDLECISLGPNGEYYLSVRSGKDWWGGTSYEVSNYINQFGSRIKFLDFADNNGVFVRYT